MSNAELIEIGALREAIIDAERQGFVETAQAFRILLHELGYKLQCGMGLPCAVCLLSKPRQCPLSARLTATRRRAARVAVAPENEVRRAMNSHDL